MNLLT